MFKQFATDLYAHFAEMCKDAQCLYRTDTDKDSLWVTYLNSFPSELNPMYRERTEHDCSCCRQFVKQIGNLVVIKDGQLTTIWDFKTANNGYQQVANAMNAFVKQHKVCGAFFTNQRKYGTKENFEYLISDDGSHKVITYNHFFVDMPRWAVVQEPSTFMSNVNSSKEVFQRALNELTMDALDIVLELIESNTLYRGTENKSMVVSFKEQKQKYDAIATDDAKSLFAWEKASELQHITHIRNTSIGTLLVNLSDGMEVDVAVTAYEKMVAPENYRRPKAIYTQRMLDDAKKQISELGYMDSLPRRYANLNDITVNDILFVDRDVSKQVFGKGEAIGFFDDMEKTVAVDPRKFSRVDEVTIDDFIDKVIPTAHNIDVLLENQHTKNMVSVIAPKDRDAKPMFKWNNPFSWTYTGNMTDSSLKANVEKAGGNVHGVLRFSIQWNDDPQQYDNNDLDAHCISPKSHIYFGKRRELGGTGNLDVDIIHPIPGEAAVENITWPSKSGMEIGDYLFFVHCYSNRGGRTGFRAEIEYDGIIHSYDYHTPLKSNEEVKVAYVTLHDDGRFSIEDRLPSGMKTRQFWGVQTQNWLPVSVIMHSPNHWDGESGIGAKHTFFMLKDCVNPEQPNPFFNEFLNSDFKDYKRVMEALGSCAKVEDTENQLSGVGFNHTQRNSVLVKVKGATERVLKVKF